MDRSGILKGLEGTDVKALRKLFVAAVLATDMSVHKDLLARVTARAAPEAGAGVAPAAELPPGVTAAAGGFSRDSSDDRQLLVSFLLHCADLCNPLFPPPMSRRIATELAIEFSRQAELERAQGLPVTVMVAHDDVGQAKVRVLASLRWRALACCAPNSPLTLRAVFPPSLPPSHPCSPSSDSSSSWCSRCTRRWQRSHRRWASSASP
jgi:hypothetical protein